MRKQKHLSMAYTLGNKCAKNCCKRAILVQLIVEDLVTCFFETRVIWQTIASRRIPIIFDEKCFLLSQTSGYVSQNSDTIYGFPQWCIGTLTITTHRWAIAKLLHLRDRTRYRSNTVVCRYGKSQSTHFLLLHCIRRNVPCEMNVIFVLVLRK